jgi:transposase
MIERGGHGLAGSSWTGGTPDQQPSLQGSHRERVVKVIQAYRFALDPALAWWGENSKCAYQEAFRDLDRALRHFVRSRKGGRKGKRLGFPRFKKRGKCRDSFRFPPGRSAAGVRR